MLVVGPVKSLTFQIVDSPNYPVFQFALGAIIGLGALYLLKKESIFLSYQKICVSSVSAYSSALAIDCFRLKGSIDSLKNKGPEGYYQMALLASKYKNERAHRFYLDLLCGQLRWSTDTEKYIQIALIASECGDQEGFHLYMGLAKEKCSADTIAHKHYLWAQLCLKYNNKDDYLFLMEMAASQWHEKASVELGLYYHSHNNKDEAQRFLDPDQLLKYIKAATDQNDLPALQKIGIYFYNTGRLLLARKYLSSHPDRHWMESIEKELKKIDDWKQMPDETFICTDTYNTISSAPFFCPKEVSNVVLINPSNLEVFVENTLPLLKNLIGFRLEFSSYHDRDNTEKVIEALKGCSSLNSLKLNTYKLTMLDSPLPLNLENFPHLHTLHLGTPAIISGFTQSRLTDISIVLDQSCQSTYTELLQEKNLKNVTSLSIKMAGNLSGVLNLSHLKNVRNLSLIAYSQDNIYVTSPKRIPSLKFLNLYHTVIVNENRKQVTLDLSLFENIETLKIARGAPTGPQTIQVTPCPISDLSSLTHLKFLLMDNVALVDDKSYLENQTCITSEALQILELYGCQLKHSLNLSCCGKLVQLRICNSYDMQDSNFSITGIAASQNLTALAIRGFNKLFSNDSFRDEFRELSPQLKIIDIRKNDLEDISFIPFPKCVHLQKLGLSHNKINIPPKELSQLPSSCTVYIGDNQIAPSTLEDLKLVIQEERNRNSQLGPKLGLFISPDNFWIRSLNDHIITEKQLLHWANSIQPRALTKHLQSRFINSSSGLESV
ncbi:MAG: hypothetical protein ACOVOR_01550 [Rhabdochlamydiaceae bacterium]